MIKKILAVCAVVLFIVVFAAKITPDRYFVKYDVVGGPIGKEIEVAWNNPLVDAEKGKPVYFSIKLNTIAMMTTGIPDPCSDYEHIIVREITHQWF